MSMIWFVLHRCWIVPLWCWLQGRTGVMICAYLLHSGLVVDPEAALQLYSMARTMDEKVWKFSVHLSLALSSVVLNTVQLRTKCCAYIRIVLLLLLLLLFFSCHLFQRYSSLVLSPQRFLLVLLEQNFFRLDNVCHFCHHTSSVNALEDCLV